jgi:uncharacterized membrane protein
VDRPNLLQRRWRVIVAAVVGLAIGAVANARLHVLPGLASLIGWNAAGVFYAVTTLWMLWWDDAATVRRRATYEDEGQSVTQFIVLSAVAASLGATVIALRDAKAANQHAPAAPWAWLLSVSTLMLGWIILQAVFALRYAHLYFGDDQPDPERGVTFPGQRPTTYRDFIYMAVCIGASAQVSDFSVTTGRFRDLVTLHSLLAFFFNTMVLALGINILASVVGG